MTATFSISHRDDPALEHIAKHEQSKTKKTAYENIIWALLNSKGFLFNQ